MTGEIYDARPEIALLCETMALDTDNRLTANAIAQEINMKFVDKYKGRAYLFLQIETLRTMVYRLRQREFGEWEALIMQHPTCSVSASDTRNFLHFNINVTIDNKFEKVK